MCYIQQADDILASIEQGDILGLDFLLEDYACWKAHIDHAIFENTAVHIAVATRNISIIRLLLKRNFPADGFNEQGYMPIHVAAMNGCLLTIQQLLNARVDLESRDIVETPYVNGRTPLFFAVERGHFKVAQYLLDCGACINAKDSIGRTPLFYAVVWKNAAMTKKLLENGASVNIKTFRNSTVLHEIMGSPFPSDVIVKLLTCWGADWEEKDTRGETPYKFLSSHKQNMPGLFWDQNRVLRNIDHFLVDFFSAVRHTYQLQPEVPNRIISYFLRVHADWGLLEYVARKRLDQFIGNTIQRATASFRAKMNESLALELQDLIVVKSVLGAMQDYYDIPEADGQVVINHFFWKYRASNMQRIDSEGHAVHPYLIQRRA